jgi:hypothetical protein
LAPLIEDGRRGLCLGVRHRDVADPFVDAMVDLGSERSPWGESAEGLTGAVETNASRELIGVVQRELDCSDADSGHVEPSVLPAGSAPN